MTPLSELGSALADRYRLERELGAGGMATVYLAEDLKHRRKVAVKVLRPDLAATLGPERFLREITIAANLQHPHILPLHDSGEADGFLYYVMPFVDGISLREKLTRDGELPIPDAVRILRDLADAMAHAHSQGVVHRDIKPENIMLSGRHALVTDFGVAKAVSEATGRHSLTTAGVALGTPAYMAPEQAAADPHVDHRADLYAFGVVAYELLTGQPPFTAATPQALLSAQVTMTPQPVTAHRPSIPPALAGLVMKCLEKKPADRYQSADELIPQLEAVLTPSGGTTPTATRAVPGASQRDNRLLAGAVAGLAVVATVAWVVTTKRAPTSAPAVETAKSIAVLPLVNVGGDSTQEYFADGMAEELANALGKVPGLRVAARTSSFAFKGQPNLDVREVGDKLGVAVVLQGSVRRAGEQMRVSVQLIDARQRLELWSGRYDRPVKDAFAVQDSITQAIVSQLALTLGGAELAATRAGRTGNPEAHDLYLQGLAVYQQSTEPAMRLALDYFRNALAKDPDYAQAYEGIALAYVSLADAFMPGIAYDSAGMAAGEALKRDSQAGANHVILGYASYATDWDLGKAEREMRLGVALSPNSSWAAMFYGNFLCGIGRIDAGLAQLDRAIELDRLNPVGPFVRGWCLYIGRRYDAVIAQYAGPAPMVYLDTFLGATYREQGRYQEALAEYARAQAMAEQPLYGYAVTYARMGRMKEAREILGRLEAYAERHYVNPFFLAAIHASLGDKDRAFESLERAARDRTLMIAWLNYWPEFDSLHADPRFAALGRRLGLPGSR